MRGGKNNREDNLTFEVASKLWNYDPDNGLLQWKERDRDQFTSENRWLKFNESKAGTVCGTKTKRGYLVTGFDGSQYYVHRIAWLLHYGEWPRDSVDHINRDKTDNRIVNLRNVSPAINTRNGSKSSRNNSGKVGVSYCETTQIWRARWSNLDGTRGYFGRSANKYGYEEAKRLVTEVYDREIERLNAQGAGYSTGHGEGTNTPNDFKLQIVNKKRVSIGRVISHGKLFWRVQYFTDRQRSKMFSVDKYGEDSARQMAQGVYDEISREL